ncbi:MAG: hypothetical protein RIQ52_842 [Pseudomonadota bacterium]|jgi:hypothetical protein
MNILLLIIALELGLVGVGAIIYLMLDQRRRMAALKSIMSYWLSTAAERESIRKERSSALVKNLGLKEYEGVELQNRWRHAEMGFLSDTFRRLESNSPNNFGDFAQMHARQMAEHDQALIDIYLRDKRRAAAVARQASRNAAAEAATEAALAAEAAAAAAEVAAVVEAEHLMLADGEAQAGEPLPADDTDA